MFLIVIFGMLNQLCMDVCVCSNTERQSHKQHIATITIAQAQNWNLVRVGGKVILDKPHAELPETVYELHYTVIP